MKRLPVILVASLLSGCAGMMSWDGGARGERQSSPGLQGKAPPLSSTGTHRPAPPRLADDPTPVAIADGDYRVQAGDTLYSIAFRNHLDFRELARWNGIGSDYRISVGQLLRLSPPPRKPGQVAPVVVVAAPKPVQPGRAPEAYTPMPALPSGFEWTWPTRGTVLRGFGEGSKGMDISGELGQPVFAAAPGRVVYSGNALKGYGELIIIKHDETHLSAYGYNRRRHVVEGDVVTAGQPIGELGLGPENKPLLHFEIRSRGKPVNPAGILPKPG